MTTPKFGLRKPAPKKERISPEVAQQATSFGMNTTPEMPLERMPMRVGQLILADHEKQALQEIDIDADELDPNTVLPADFPNRLAAAKRAQVVDMEDAINEVATKQKPLRMPRERNMKELPRQKREELVGAMEQAKIQLEQLEKIKGNRAAMGNLSPSVRNTAMAAGGIEVFDSRGRDVSARVSKVTMPKVVEEEEDYKVEERAPEGPPIPEDTAPPLPVNPGLLPEPVLACPHCGWDQNKPEVAKPTKTDWVTYVTSLCSEDGNPFLKQYTLFGGKVQVTFRDISTAASEMVNQQVDADRFGTKGFAASHWADYRTLLALHTVVIAGEPYEVGDSLDEFLAEQPPASGGDTALVEALASIRGTGPFGRESFWRALVNQWVRFNALVEFMESRAGDESFCRAIEA